MQATHDRRGRSTASRRPFDPAAAETHDAYGYASQNPLRYTDPLGLFSWDSLGAGLAGFADTITGGLSSMLLSAAVPGYDCFVEKHQTAFSVGQVVGTVVEVAAAAVTIVATAGAGTALVAAATMGRAALKAGIKMTTTAIKTAATATTKKATSNALTKSTKEAVEAGANSAATRPVPSIKTGSAGGESAGMRFPQSVREQARADDPSTCVYCRMETDKPQIDHSIPRAQGGNATFDNAQTTCGWCNASTGAREFPLNPPPNYFGAWPPAWWTQQ